MKFIEQIGDAILIESNYFEDERGVFLKVFNTDLEPLKQFTVKQINYVMTNEKHTLRGLHYQKDQFAESKMFRIIKGEAQLAFVDVRPTSSTYLQAYTYTLNNPRQAIIIPQGFATGYCTLTEDVVMLYAADNDYFPSAEAGLLWNDPKLSIPWKTQSPILSEKDKVWAQVSDSQTQDA
jgi:dTDP-4-dehydrorhamnose 3,5-epimerase